MKQILVATAILMLLSIASVHGDEVDDLILDLKYGQDAVRADAALALGNIGDLRAVGPLIAVLKDKSSRVRENAASSLGKIGDVRAVDPLLESLKDEDEGVRAQSALALGDIGDSRAVGRLAEVFNGDYYRWIRLCAAGALVKLGKQEYFDPITQELKNDDSNTRKWAAISLGHTSDPRAVEPLNYLIQNDRSSDVVSAATEALYNISKTSMPINASDS